jgi:hypothetical protein
MAYIFIYLTLVSSLLRKWKKKMNPKNVLVSVIFYLFFFSSAYTLVISVDTIRINQPRSSSSRCWEIGEMKAALKQEVVARVSSSLCLVISVDSLGEVKLSQQASG